MAIRHSRRMDLLVRPQARASSGRTRRSTTRPETRAPTGPAAGRPGYDFAIQAASGLMSITGAAQADGGQPTKVGVAISDELKMIAAVGL